MIKFNIESMYPELRRSYICPNPPPAPGRTSQSPGLVFVFIRDEYIAIPATGICFRLATNWFMTRECLRRTTQKWCSDIRRELRGDLGDMFRRGDDVFWLQSEILHVLFVRLSICIFHTLKGPRNILGTVSCMITWRQRVGLTAPAFF